MKLTSVSLAISSLVFLSSTSAMAADHYWNFDDPNDRFLNAGEGGSAAASLDYFDPFATGWGPRLTSFGTASSFGLPALPGGDAQVMSFPAAFAEQGYALTHGGDANGVFVDSGLISNYTLVFDVLYPSASDSQWRPFFQTDGTNSSSADFYVNPENGIGISGGYNGVIQPDTWHRVVVVVRAAPGEGQLHKYIDGNFVGGQGTTGSAIGEGWAIGDAIQLLTDNSNDNAAGYLSSVRFIDRNLTMAEARALGKPTASGAQVAGPAADPFPYELPREVDIIAHRGESCCAPEDTLSAIGLAFDEGADYCEIDIRLSSDGVAVLMHDATVDRTTNGSGNVTDFTAAQLGALDAGSWFSDEFVGEPVPTLEEAFTLAKAKGGKLYLDIKVNGMASAIKTAMDNAGVPTEDVWYWVYNQPAEAAAIRAVHTDAKIIWEDRTPTYETDPDYWNDLRAIGVFGFDMAAGTGEPDRDFVAAAMAEGFYISNYTLLDPDALISAVSHGAMGLETDFVAITESMMPPYDIFFTVPTALELGTELGAEQLNATSSIPGAFTYDPPAGTILPVGTSTIAATFTPDDLNAFPVRTVIVPVTMNGEPVELTTDKAVYDFNETIRVTYGNGPANLTDWLGIYPAGTIPDGDPAASSWFYLDGTQTDGLAQSDGALDFIFSGLSPGEWDVFFLANDGYGILAGPVTITVRTPQISSFAPLSYAFEAGGNITLLWDIPGDGSNVESLVISDGATTTDVLGRTSITFPAPGDIVTYTLTLNDDASANTTVFPANTAGGEITTPRTEYLVGENVEVTFSGGPGNISDWLGIYRGGEVPDGDPASREYLYVGGSTSQTIGLSEGSLTFDLAADPLPIGEYVIFFFQNDIYDRIADPIRLSIVETLTVDKTLEITSFERVGDNVNLTWSSAPGLVYQVQSSTDLATWENVDDAITAEDVTTSEVVVPPFSNGPKRFFQVILVE